VVLEGRDALTGTGLVHCCWCRITKIQYHGNPKVLLLFLFINNNSQIREPIPMGQ